MASNTFEFKIVSPDGKNYSDSCEILNLTLKDGAIGILKGHTPIIGIIEICIMDYVKQGKRICLTINGGVLNVKKDEVLILADSFETKDQIDKDRVLKAKARAEERIKSNNANIDLKRAEVALKKAINRLTLIN